MDQDDSWRGDRSWARRLYVRWGPNPPPQKGRSHPPQFLANFHCGQTAGCIKVQLGMEFGFSPDDFVLDRESDPSQKGGGAPPPSKFSAHIYSGQTAGWMKLVYLHHF